MELYKPHSMERFVGDGIKRVPFNKRKDMTTAMLAVVTDDKNGDS